MNPSNPRPEFHEEQDPTIDRAIRGAASAFRMGASEEDVLAALVKRGLPSYVAVNVVRAATILAEPVGE